MKSKWWIILYNALIIIGIVLRFHRLATRDLWRDELEQLTAFNFSLKKMLLEYLPTMPGGFPGDYLLTAPFAHMSTNKWVVGIPHIIAMFLTFWIFHLILNAERLAVPTKTVAMAAFVFNSNLIYHALELRPYAVLPLLALTNYFLAMKRFDTTDACGSFLNDLGWAALTFVTVLFHAYGGLMVGCVWLYQALTHNIWSFSLTKVRQVILPPLIGLAVAAPIWLHFATKNPELVQTFLYCGASISAVLKFIVGNLGDLSIHRFWMIPLTIITVGLFANDPLYRQRFTFFVVLIVLPVAAIFEADVNGHYWFVQRQFVWVIPFYSLLVGKSVEACIVSYRRP